VHHSLLLDRMQVHSLRVQQAAGQEAAEGHARS
jgi:hypothetical protein